METNLQREELIFDAALGARNASATARVSGRRLRQMMRRCVPDGAPVEHHEHADDFFVGCVAGMEAGTGRSGEKICCRSQA